MFTLQIKLENEKKSESRSDLTEFSDTLARPLQYQTCVCVLYLCSVRSFLVVETVSALISSILTCFDGFSFGLSDFTDNICPSLAYDPGGKSNF